MLTFRQLSLVVWCYRGEHQMIKRSRSSKISCQLNFGRTCTRAKWRQKTVTSWTWEITSAWPWNTTAKSSHRSKCRSSIEAERYSARLPLLERGFMQRHEGLRQSNSWTFHERTHVRRSFAFKTVDRQFSLTWALVRSKPKRKRSSFESSWTIFGKFLLFKFQQVNVAELDFVFFYQGNLDCLFSSDRFRRLRRHQSKKPSRTTRTRRWSQQGPKLRLRDRQLALLNSVKED